MMVVVTEYNLMVSTLFTNPMTLIIICLAHIVFFIKTQLIKMKRSKLKGQYVLHHLIFACSLHFNEYFYP